MLKLLSDILICIIKRKNNLYNAVRIIPIYYTFVLGSSGLSATFQRLIDKILRPPSTNDAAYLNDIIIYYSNDWQWHLEHVCAVLSSLRVAGLMTNLQKCAIGHVEVQYLCFHLGLGQVRPQIDKTAAIAACPSAKTKK